MAHLVRYGEYLAGPVAHCADCHTPMGRRGRRILNKLFAGGFDFKGPWGTSYASNLTPDEETGIGTWTDEDIIKAIYGLKRDLKPPMPSPYYRNKIKDYDLKAIIAYLRKIKPIANKVPEAKPPKRR